MTEEFECVLVETKYAGTAWAGGVYI